MRPNKPTKLNKKHPATARDAMEDVRDLSGDPRPLRNEIRYMEPNRDRALGTNDRTGRHFDEETPQDADQGSAASKDHEAD